MKHLLKATLVAICFVLSSTAFAQQTFPIGPDATLIIRPQQPQLVCYTLAGGQVVCVGG